MNTHTSLFGTTVAESRLLGRVTGDQRMESAITKEQMPERKDRSVPEGQALDPERLAADVLRKVQDEREKHTSELRRIDVPKESDTPSTEEVIRALGRRPTGPEVTAILAQVKLHREDEKNQSQQQEVERRIQNLKLNEREASFVRFLPESLRLRVLDSINEIRRITPIFEKFSQEFRVIFRDPKAMELFARALYKGEMEISDQSEAGRKVRALLANPAFTDADRKVCMVLGEKFKLGLDTPVTEGESPEKQAEQAAGNIGALQKVLKEADKTYKGKPPAEGSRLEGWVFVFKGLLIMEGIDVEDLEKNDWEKVRKWHKGDVAQSVPNDGEHQFMKLGGLILFAIGVCQVFKGEIAKRFGKKEEVSGPNELQTMDGDKLEGELNAAKENKKKNYKPEETVEKMEEDLRQKQALPKLVEPEAKASFEKEVAALQIRIEELKRLEARIKQLEEEKQRREKAEKEASQWLEKKGVIVGKSGDKRTLTFPKTAFVNPKGDEDGVAEFFLREPLHFEKETLVIATTIITMKPDGFHLTDPGTPEIVYKRLSQTETPKEKTK